MFLNVWVSEHAVATVLLTKYYLGDQMEKNEIGRSCCMYGQRRSVHRVLVGRPEGRRSLDRPRRRWKYIIKIDLYEVSWGGAWTGLIWLRIEAGGGHLLTPL